MYLTRIKLINIRAGLFLILFIFSFVFYSPISLAQTASSSLKGRILLQVEKNGQAWYVDPIKNSRAFLGRPADAFQVMRGFGLGINDSDMEKIRQSTAKRRKLSGRILIQVEAKGAAFYVNPPDLTLNYLGRPADAFQIMRTLALGISDKDLKKIAVNPQYRDVDIAPPIQAAAIDNPINVGSISDIDDRPIIATNYCTAWTYTDWSPCSPQGNQIRSIVTFEPANCTGGNYVLEQTCTYIPVNHDADDNLLIQNASSTPPSFDDLFLAAAFLDNGKNVGLTCKPWVNKILSTVTSGAMVLPFQGANDYSWALNLGSRVVNRNTAIENVSRADIIQFNIASKNNLPHTAIVVSTSPTGMYWIHSNWQKAYTVSMDFFTYAFFKSIAGVEYSIYHIQ